MLPNLAFSVESPPPPGHPFPSSLGCEDIGSPLYGPPRKPIPATEILETIKEALTRDPTITMNSRIPEVYELYERGFYYFIDAVQRSERSRRDIELIVNISREMHRHVKARGLLSFSEFLFIGDKWSDILSLRRYRTLGEDLEDVLSQIREHFLKIYEAIERAERGDRPTSESRDEGPRFLAYADEIIVPYVSKTGLLPVTLINDAIVFQIKTPEGLLLKCVKFVGIPINETVSYDDEHNQPSRNFILHDMGHATIGPLNSLGQPRYKENLKEAWFYRQKILSETDDLKKKQMELAFFLAFHEFDAVFGGYVENSLPITAILEAMKKYGPIGLKAILRGFSKYSEPYDLKAIPSVCDTLLRTFYPDLASNEGIHLGTYHLGMAISKMWERLYELIPHLKLPTTVGSGSVYGYPPYRSDLAKAWQFHRHMLEGIAALQAPPVRTESSSN